MHPIKWRIWGIMHAAFSILPTDDFRIFVGAYALSKNSFISLNQISIVAWVSAMVRILEFISQQHHVGLLPLPSRFPPPCIFSGIGEHL
jgi:hypothetical protein